MTEKIRRAVHDAIHENPAKIKGEGIALKMGISCGNLYRYGEEGGEIPLNRLIQLILITKDLRPVMAFCETVGGTFLPINKEKAEKIDIKTLKEFSDFMQARSKALADGNITTAELSRIKKEGTEAIAIIAQAMADAERIFKEE